MKDHHVVRVAVASRTVTVAMRHGATSCSLRKGRIMRHQMWVSVSVLLGALACVTGCQTQQTTTNVNTGTQGDVIQRPTNSTDVSGSVGAAVGPGASASATNQPHPSK